eukprot:c2339_g1_i1.p1 GENE.c2339_g1_i1~~c2339_g1_i1.p1  ORF type:complete len:302 (+),score=23.09 c2339_g1_i1:127-906(+)
MTERKARPKKRRASDLDVAEGSEACVLQHFVFPYKKERRNSEELLAECIHVTFMPDGRVRHRESWELNAAGEKVAASAEKERRKRRTIRRSSSVRDQLEQERQQRRRSASPYGDRASASSEVESNSSTSCATLGAVTSSSSRAPYFPGCIVSATDELVDDDETDAHSEFQDFSAAQLVLMLRSPGSKGGATAAPAAASATSPTAAAHPPPGVQIPLPRMATAGEPPSPGLVAPGLSPVLPFPVTPVRVGGRAVVGDGLR